jgi:hypothetical protein
MSRAVLSWECTRISSPVMGEQKQYIVWTQHWLRLHYSVELEVFYQCDSEVLEQQYQHVMDEAQRQSSTIISHRYQFRHWYPSFCRQLDYRAS